MEQKEHDERRKHIRVHFKTRILLCADGIEIDAEGSSKDLSMKGVFITTDKHLPLGTACDVKILLSGGIKDLELTMEATVARVEPTGIGLAFDSIDLDSFTHLKNIVLYNSDGDARII